MGTREQLRANPRVDNDDIDDIIGIAQELQTAARDEADQATVQEVKDEFVYLEGKPPVRQRCIYVRPTFMVAGFTRHLRARMRLRWDFV